MSEITEHLPLICHCLIGPPGAGKSTLAQQWVKRSPHYHWISTDHIRQDLFGNAAVQGNWPQVEAEVIRQIKQAIATGQPVIYDATNAKRAWRLSLMQHLSDGQTQWMGWWLKTPLAVCQTQNRGRDRQVDDDIIADMYKALKGMPPIPAEGFVVVNSVPLQDGKFGFDVIQRKIQTLPQSLLQRQRRQANCQLHPYSSLLAFERLLYLIAVLLKYPGVGNLQQHEPSLLQQLLQLEKLPYFDSPVAEISALINCKYGELYAEPSAIAQNLHWLETNGIINSPYIAKPIEVPKVAGPANFPLHRYSDRDVFERLINTLRFIAYHPFLYRPSQGSLQTLIATMETQGVIAVGYADSVRRDIGEILKPYGLMEKTAQTQGYFVGTAILSKSELLRIFSSLEGQAKHLDDPIALAAYETFQQRLRFLHPETSHPYPVRTVLQQPIVDVQQLPVDTQSLAAPTNAERLEDAIIHSRVLTLKRRWGTGRFVGDVESSFQILPLQIVFHSIAWYLGYEHLTDGLLRFERLDRLEIVQAGNFTRSKTAQAKARQNLIRLYEASYGLYLGNSAEDQRKFLSPDSTHRAEIEVSCELWFSDSIFRFISEGTQRFPGRQRMSPRLTGAAMSQTEKQTIFTLSKTGDSKLPNRFQVDVPKWILMNDVDFKRWILGFGGEVKVVSPQFFADEIKACGREIWRAYRDRV